MHARYISLIMLGILSFSLGAQNRFSIDDTIRLVSGGTTWGVLHHFVQANNHAGDTLDMHWRKKVIGNPPSAWVVNFADPESNHPDISMIDSLDFYFPDSASSHTTNKFVIGINPHGAVGSANYVFTIFEKQFPADSVKITYQVDVYSSMDVPEWSGQMSVYPNPASEILHIPEVRGQADIAVYNTKGQEFHIPLKSSQENQFDVSTLPAGIYFLRLEEGNEAQLIKISITH